jgi:hypothetical protein
MKKVIKLTESDLTRIVKRVVKEELSDRSGELYSRINRLIDGEFSDMEHSEIFEVLKHIAKSHESSAYRKMKGIGPISKDEVLKNFKFKM